MHHHTISLPGQTLAAISSNETLGGPPVVFIHGITATVDYWLPSMPAEIREGRRWISLSLPGHYPAKIERSAIGSFDSVTPEMWAGWHETALEQLIGDEPADFVGWSTGGFSSLALAMYHPRRVRSLLSISGFAIGKWLGLIGGLQRLSLSSLTRWFVRYSFGAVGRRRLLFNLAIRSGAGDSRAFLASPFYEPTMNDWFTAWGQNDPMILAELFRIISQLDLSEGIGRISCPTLIAGGDSDPYIPARHTQWIADHVPGAELVRWPGAGHMFFAERSQHYQDLLIRWLNQNSSSSRHESASQHE